MACECRLDEKLLVGQKKVESTSVACWRQTRTRKEKKPEFGVSLRRRLSLPRVEFPSARRLFVGLTSESSGHLSNSDCTRQSRSCLKYTHNIHFNHHTKKCILVAVFYSVWESCKPPDQSCPTCAINDIVKMKRMRTWQRSRSLASSNHFIRGDQPELNYFHVLRVAGTTASTRCGNILTLH